MGVLVDLTRYRADRQLRQAMDHLSEPRAEAPSPREFGWLPGERAEDGVPIRWFHPKYRAIIGYVPGRPDLVFLDYRFSCQAWEHLTLSDLVVGVETGILPDPDVDLNWAGDPVEVPQP